MIKNVVIRALSAAIAAATIMAAVSLIAVDPASAAEPMAAPASDQKAVPSHSAAHAAKVSARQRYYRRHHYRGPQVYGSPIDKGLAFYPEPYYVGRPFFYRPYYGTAPLLPFFDLGGHFGW